MTTAMTVLSGFDLFSRALGVIGTLGVLGAINVQGVASAERWTKKMLERAKAAGNDWVDGMQNPSADPKAAALAAKGKWKQKMTDAINNNNYEKGIQKYNPEDALATAMAVGASGYVAGITARESKIAKAIAILQPKVAALKNKIAAMPQDTDQQREARLLEARRGMIAIGK